MACRIVQFPIAALVCGTTACSTSDVRRCLEFSSAIYGLVLHGHVREPRHSSL